MTKAAIDALRSEQARAQELLVRLTPEEWEAPSGCAGWRVQDVVCHMASVFHLIADPTTIEGGAGTDAEADAEVPVQARKDWTPEQVVAEYQQWSDAGIAALAAMQEPGMAEMVIPMANLGHHPMHLLANAIVFDHYCHLRHDIGAAVADAADLERDHQALEATLEWMLAGLPQMCAAELAAAPAVPVALVLEGPGGGQWVLEPAGDSWAVSPGGGATAVFTSTAHEFVSWGTKRADWRDHGVLTGDADGGAAAVLDAINVI